MGNMGNIKNIFNENLLRGKIKNNYSIIEKIDEDFFSEVFKSKSINGNELVTIKVINKSYLTTIYGDKKEKIFENIRSEINSFKRITNKYSLKLIDSLETLEFFNIVFEYYDSTLEQYLIERNFGLSMKEIKLLFNKLNVGLREIVIKGIIHGDLNLSNIKIKNQDNELIPLLSDYGQKIILEGKLRVVNSNLNFYAPELLEGEQYDNKIDLWSIGVILYSLYYNEYPFNSNNQIEIFNQIQNNKLKKSKNKDFDDLMEKLLQKDPKSRITWNEYFNHNFWKINDTIDEDCYYEDDYLGKKFSNDIDSINPFNKSLSKSVNIQNKKCNIYYGINNGKKNKNKLEKIELSYKDFMANKNFLLSSLDQKESIQDIYKLVIYDCNFSNLEILSKASFENLTELDLCNNRIINIEPLTQAQFKKLTLLSLCNNKINNLDSLVNVPFINLKDLRLSYNEISNIDVFEKVPFVELSKLILSSNEISDISVLKNAKPLEKLTYLALNDNKILNVEINISSLIYLDLCYNQINDIKLISCKNLMYLNLGKNKISNIIPLRDNSFSNLTTLHLYDNQIKNINIFSDVHFINLVELNLSHNEIEDIDVFSRVPFKKIKKLNLTGNKIYNIGGLTKLSFEDLEEFSINDNEIKYGNSFNGKIIDFLKEKYKSLKFKY